MVDFVIRRVPVHAESLSWVNIAIESFKTKLCLDPAVGSTPLHGALCTKTPQQQEY
jgi:hypothetical protein